MARREVMARVCDRCAKPTPAVSSAEVCFQRLSYKLDLCQKHTDMFDNEMYAWLRLGTEVESVHAARTWVPGAAFKEKKKPVVVDDTGMYVNGVRQSRKLSLDLPPARGADVVVETDVEPFRGGPDEDLDDFTGEDLKITQAVIDQMAALQLSWDTVTNAVEQAFAVTPSRRAGVSAYLTADLSVLVADDGAVLGVAKRDPAEPMPHTSQTHAKRFTRKGRRGGQGRVAMDTEQIVDAINSEPGWWVDNTRPHYVAHGPDGQQYHFPKTTSDWRGPMKTLQGLRREGLDLLSRARAGAQAG